MAIERKNMTSYAAFAAAMGGAVATGWISSSGGDAFAAIHAGLSLVEASTERQIDLPTADAFLDGALRSIAMKGVDLLEEVHRLGLDLAAHASDRVGEMREYMSCRSEGPIGQPAEALSPSGEDTGCTGAPLRVIDVSKEILDALDTVIKAWTLFKLARKALTWGLSRISADAPQMSGREGVSDDLGSGPVSPIEDSAPDATEFRPGEDRGVHP